MRWIVLILVASVLGFGAWAVTWALTATPVGSAGLDQELAGIARWPGQAKSAGAASYARFEEALAAYRVVLADAPTQARRTLPKPDVISDDEIEAQARTIGGLSLHDLLASDDEEPWLFIIESESFAGREGSGWPRSVLRARAEGIMASDLVGRLCAVAHGPRPAISAEQLAAMGYGVRNPVEIMLSNLNESRRVAVDLLELARANAVSGDHSTVPDLILAAEAVAQGVEAVPTLIHHLVASAIRARMWSIASDLAARGQLDEGTIDALADQHRSSIAGFVPETRRNRVLAAEWAFVRGVLGHLHDARGRALPVMWSTATGTQVSTGARLGNLMGLLAPNRGTVERRLEELFAGTGPPLEAPSGLAAIRHPDRLSGMLMPNIHEGLDQLEQASVYGDLFTVALAVASFTARTGTPPATLEDLTLPAELLVDPFHSEGALFQYEILDAAPAAAEDDETPRLRWRVWSRGRSPLIDDDDLVMPNRDPAP